MVPSGETLRTLRRSIHPSAWKKNSANFACIAFSEVGLSGRRDNLQCAIMSVERANPSGSKRVGKEDVVLQRTVTSVDGTLIAYWRSGDGPPLVLVHGSFDDHNVWAPVLPAFEERFTVYAVDRRGRGGSGDGTGHSLESEAADIAEVVESIGGQEVNLLGHSYGGVCALEAARRTTHVRRLVLYEPAVPAGIAFFPPGVIDRIETLVGEGEREEAGTVFARDVAKLPPDVLDFLREDPSWQASVAAAHTLPREMRAVEGYVLDPALLRGLETPTLLLLGGDTLPSVKAAAEAVDEALANCRIVVMPGQGHVAMNTGTELFTSEVLRFLTAE
jgi:pimeloyl-ACP methyl ester carboxylesterase